MAQARKAGSRARRKPTSKRRGASQGGMMPWLAVTLVVAGGILAYENRDRLRPVVSMATAAIPARPAAVPAKAPERPMKVVAAPAVARPIPPARPTFAPPAAIPVVRPATDVAAIQTVSAASTGKPVSASFGYCGDGPHRNCVADGATFWHDGVKIGIAGIRTAAVDRPACENERTRGVSAKVRLLGLLNAGPFTLQANSPAQDGTGRTLRTVQRDGQSVGSILVREGLATPDTGARQAWCS